MNQICLNLAVILWLPVPCQMMSVDDMCYSRMPKTKRQINTRHGPWNFINICSDIELFTDCILTLRSLVQASSVEVEKYEKAFPKEEDVRIAGYLFCSHDFKHFVSMLMPIEKDIVTCEKSANFIDCDDTVRKWHGKRLDNISSPNYMNLSCKASVMYYNCLEKIYTKCSADFEDLLLYYTARLGTECLIAEKKSNHMVLSEQCTRSQIACAPALRSPVHYLVLFLLYYISFHLQS